jgi:serine/threonine-protein kinase
LALGAASYFIFFNKKKKSDSNISNTSKGTPSSAPESSTPTSNAVLSYTDMNGLLIYRSDCFVIINGSYAEEINAINAVNSMRVSGYTNAGFFWRPDYPSINDKYLYSTFIGPYQTYNECEKNLRVFKQSNAYWYGIKISYDNTRVEIR